MTRFRWVLAGLLATMILAGPGVTLVRLERLGNGTHTFTVEGRRGH